MAIVKQATLVGSETRSYSSHALFLGYIRFSVARKAVDVLDSVSRAADWKLDAPDWTGRLRVVAKGKDITLKLEDKISGEERKDCTTRCRSIGKVLQSF